jgi:hypothetical protein
MFIDTLLNALSGAIFDPFCEHEPASTRQIVPFREKSGVVG